MIIKVKKWYFVKTLYEYGDVHVMRSHVSWQSALIATICLFKNGHLCYHHGHA